MLDIELLVLRVRFEFTPICVPFTVLENESLLVDFNIGLGIER